nr:hypothetical protein [Denitromonas sp.]
MSLIEQAELPEKIRAALPFSRYLKQMLQSRTWLAGQLASHLDTPLDTAAMAAFIYLIDKYGL